MTTIGEAVIEVKADTSGLSSSISRATRGSGSTFGKLGGGMGKALGLGLAGGVATGATALVGGLAKSISLAKDFDLTIRQVGVQTGQTGKQMEGLRTLAVKMGQDTVFSAQDAAGAMLELAKGGLTSAEIKAGALKTTLTLAAAGGIDLGNAATYVVQGMTTFGIKASHANDVAVALAGGANASTASVESLGQALSQVGPGAKTAGFSLQETVAALSAFDNAGIKGADAGTSLKTMLTRLVPSTKKSADAMKRLGLDFTDSKGRIDSLATISEKLKKRLGGLSQEAKTKALSQIFGSDAARAATVLMDNGRKGIEKYIKATKNQRTVQKMANTTMSGASGAWENLKGSVETVGIQIGSKLLPIFAKGAKGASDFIGKISSGKGPVGGFGDLIGQIGPKFSKAIGGSAGLKKALANMTPYFDAAKTAGKALLRAFIGSIPAIVGLFKIWTQYVGFLGLAFKFMWNNGIRWVLKAILLGLGAVLKTTGLLVQGLALIAPPGVRGRMKAFGKALGEAGDKAFHLAAGLHAIKDKKVHVTTDTEKAAAAIRRLQALRDRLKDKHINFTVMTEFRYSGKPKRLPGVNANSAIGGTHGRGEWGLVGEHGPELMHYTGNGRARVETHSRSKGMLGGGSPSTLVVVDADGHLIGRMRVEAGHEVASAGAYAGTMGRMR